jgi:polyferredoxin
MIFDWLPYPNSRYRLPGRWGWLRYAHFALSLALVLALWFGAGYRDGALGATGMRWFVAGLLLYYAVGIALAFALKDNRAFCKYVCPIAVLPKISGRLALLKIAGTPIHCGDCEACVEMCPMNIRVRDYIVNGERVLSTECTLCQTCIHVCPHESLRLSFGLDVGGKEYIDFVPPRKNRNGR